LLRWMICFSSTLYMMAVISLSSHHSNEIRLPSDFHCTHEEVKDQRGTVTQPWSQSLDIPDQISEFLHLNGHSITLLYIPYPLNPGLEDTLGSGPWRDLSCSSAGSVFTSSMIFWQTDRSPHDTAWSHLSFGGQRLCHPELPISTFTSSHLPFRTIRLGSPSWDS
jgi:hypothetical protein